MYFTFAVSVYFTSYLFLSNFIFVHFFFFAILHWNEVSQRASFPFLLWNECSRDMDVYTTYSVSLVHQMSASTVMMMMMMCFSLRLWGYGFNSVFTKYKNLMLNLCLCVHFRVKVVGVTNEHKKICGWCYFLYVNLYLN